MRNLGFAIGMVLGAAAGLFLAPRRGGETRARLAQAAQDAVERAAPPVVGARPGRRAHTPCAPTL